MPPLAPKLAASTVFALLVGCTIPSTLGLPCQLHAHCDAGQHCGPNDTCVQGPPPMMTATSGPPPMTAGGPGGTSTDPSTTDPSATSVSLDSSTSAGITDTGSTSTGPACGQAVGTCDHVDVLMLIDNSGSIEEETSQWIISGVNPTDLLESVVDGPCTYQIGVTTTEPDLDFQPEECRLRGALSRSGAIAPGGTCFPNDPDHPPWISEDDDINRLGCLLAVGTNNEDDEKQFDTLLTAVGPELGAPGACNEGFIREGVPLVVIMITDEDDDDDSSTPGETPDRTGSSGGPDDWWEAITAIKPASDLAFIVITATDLAGCNWTPDNDDGVGAEYADRILGFAARFIGVGYGDHVESADICEPADRLLPQITELQQAYNAMCEDAVGGLPPPE